MWLHYSMIICTGCGQWNASHSKSAYWWQRQSTAWHHGIWANCASQFRLFPPYLSAPHSTARGDLVVPRTRLQLSNWRFCVADPIAWNSLPLDICSEPTLSTFKKHAQDTSFLTFLLYWLITVSRVRAANIIRRPCIYSSHVTAHYKFSFYYYYYYYYLITFLI